MELVSCPNCKSQDLQVDFVYCPYCGKQLVKPGKCSTCGHQNAVNAKFCQECGTALQSSRSEQMTPSTVTILEEEPVPINGITIEFGYSSSANFDFAVQAAELFSSLKIYGEGKKAVYRINFSQSEIESTIELVKFVRGWKSSRLYVDGAKTTWDAVLLFFVVL